MPLPALAGLALLGTRLATFAPKVAQGLSQAGALARVVGAGATRSTAGPVRAVAQGLRKENLAARVAYNRAPGQKTLEELSNLPQKLGKQQAYSQAEKIVGANSGLYNAAYQTGNVLNKVAGAVNSPVANIALTGAFLAPMLLPQGQAEYATEPFNNAYTQLPTPSGGQFAVDPRGGEMIGGMQAAAQVDGQGGAPYGLTDEQIVKAKRRAEETAQLNQLYASTLSGYQMPN